MTANELRQKFLDFFEGKGHTIIPSTSLVPENDSSALFTTAGMHPLVPYLMGESHPGGKRVANVQKCVRTNDIDDVGDNRHLTFFEMLGNWSFGDYFKKEAIEWSAEFLFSEKWLGLDPKRIYVTIFQGEDGIPRDEESIKIWQEAFAKAGIKTDVAGDDGIVSGDVRIIPLGVVDNFWIAGATGPCGPDTEMFYDTRPEKGKLEGKFSDLVDNGRLVEIWNDVFMEYEKKIKNQKLNLKNTIEYEYVELTQQNVDTGMGMERTLFVLNEEQNVFKTELFESILNKIEELSGKKYQGNEKTFRIIADHIKAATFMIADGVEPLNVGRGYVLRRLIRRAVRYGKILGISDDFTKRISEVVVGIYKNVYPELEKNKKKIFEELKKEENKFKETLEKGIKELLGVFSEVELFNEVEPFKKIKKPRDFSDYRGFGKKFFDIFSTYGFPLEMIIEEINDRKKDLGFKKLSEIQESEIKQEFQKEFEKHQELSRTASAGQFKGGLQSQDENIIKLHTATHLLSAALRQVLGEHIYQKGSNITAERLRFDFSHSEKMTVEQIKKVEDLVNEQIKNDSPVTIEEMPPEEAQKQGAIGVFGHKYGEKVKVYLVGDFSREICGGPHVEHTGVLGKFSIVKEEASSAGIRRIKAILE